MLLRAFRLSCLRLLGPNRCQGLGKRWKRGREKRVGLAKATALRSHTQAAAHLGTHTLKRHLNPTSLKRHLNPTILKRHHNPTSLKRHHTQKHTSRPMPAAIPNSEAAMERFLCTPGSNPHILVSTELRMLVVIIFLLVLPQGCW